ncbi:hypothetical protein JOC36_001472 [Weissella uvarum]|uniref:hypothetical protein n=1 Tax=Weissella uvarum TaxID=1479233 RepID=UPI0019601A21|nr:hypothetical protein [Weissella uvarum]MBM7617879.1 hypothetical protein [Weissella uvarum]MCM0596123.1 hypothetical protein [Weissella uvarum]
MTQKISYMSDNMGVPVLFSYRKYDEELGYLNAGGFTVKRIYKLKDKTVLQTERLLRRYSSTDELLDLGPKVSDYEQNLLKFIGRFKSVQHLHLLREVQTHPDLYGTNKGSTKSDPAIAYENTTAGKKWTNSIRKLYVLGLTQRWSHVRILPDGTPSTIYFYTLSDAGYKYLEVQFGKRNYYQFMSPNNFYKLPEIVHLQYWMALDIYQAINVTKPFKAVHNMFNSIGVGKKINGVYSPLQMRLDLKGQGDMNYIFYPYLPSNQPNDLRNIIDDYCELVLNRADTLYIPELATDANLMKREYPIKPVFVVQNTEDLFQLYDILFSPTHKHGDEAKNVSVLVMIMSLVKSEQEEAGLPKSFVEIFPFVPTKKDGVKEVTMENFYD